MVAGRLDHKVPNLTFRSDVPSALARPKSQKQFSGTSQPTAGTRTSESPRAAGRPAQTIERHVSASWGLAGGWMGAGGGQRGDRFLKGFQLVDDLVLRR